MGLNFGGSGISLLFVRTKRFWGGWGGGEVPQDFSVPLSPRPTPQSYRGVPWAPSPLLNRLGFRVVWCCPVLFGHTLNQRTLLGICCPSRNGPYLNSWSLRLGVSSSLFLFLVRLKLGSRFPHRTRLVFCPLGCLLAFVFGCRFFSQIFAAFCTGRLNSALRCLRPARCEWLFLRPRSAVVRSFLGFGARLAGGSLFFLSLSSLVVFFVLVVGAATPCLRSRPLLG